MTKYIEKIYEYQVFDITNPYIISLWCKKHNLKGYWYYKYPINDNISNPVFAFTNKNDLIKFKNKMKKYKEKDKDKLNLPYFD